MWNTYETLSNKRTSGLRISVVRTIFTTRCTHAAVTRKQLTRPQTSGTAIWQPISTRIRAASHCRIDLTNRTQNKPLACIACLRLNFTDPCCRVLISMLLNSLCLQISNANFNLYLYQHVYNIKLVLVLYYCTFNIWVFRYFKIIY